MAEGSSRGKGRKGRERKVNKYKTSKFKFVSYHWNERRGKNIYFCAKMCLETPDFVALRCVNPFYGFDARRNDDTRRSVAVLFDTTCETDGLGE